MRRQLVLIAMLLFQTLGVGLQAVPALAVLTTDPERQVRDLPVIKKSILDATRYEDFNLAVVIKDKQFVVTVINSKLNKATSAEREAEASAIASTIAQETIKRPEFGSIIGIHINYVSGASGASRAKIIDRIDFRKDRAGDYQPHKT